MLITRSNFTHRIATGWTHPKKDNFLMDPTSEKFHSPQVVVAQVKPSKVFDNPLEGGGVGVQQRFKLQN